jgi:hypothetical protein
MWPAKPLDRTGGGAPRTDGHNASRKATATTRGLVPMKISELLAQLEWLKENYGDLDCAVYDTEGIQPLRSVKVYSLQGFDFGRIEGRKTGDQLALVWSKPGILR